MNSLRTRKHGRTTPTVPENKVEGKPLETAWSSRAATRWYMLLGLPMAGERSEGNSQPKDLDHASNRCKGFLSSLTSHNEASIQG